MTIGASVIVLTLAAMFLWLNIMPKITALLVLAGGTGLTAGLVGQFYQQSGDWATSTAGSLTAAGFGASAAGVFGLAALVLFIHDLWPKHSAGRRTAAAALALPVTVGAIGGTVGGTAMSVLQQYESGVGTMLTTLVGG